MKKILILSMFCNDDFFLQAEKVVFQTWAKPIIDGKYPNIQFFGFTSSDDGKYHISYEQHVIRVPSDDSLKGTLEKTIKTLKFIDKIGIEYDYIFRTNTSVYVNANMLDYFVQRLYEDQTIWAGNLFMSPYFVGAPFKACMYAIGNALLLSKRLVSILIDNSYINNGIQSLLLLNERSLVEKFLIDDIFIGAILNSYFLLNEEDHTGHYKTFGLPFSYYTHRISPSDVIAVKCRQPGEANERISQHEYEQLISIHEMTDFDKTPDWYVIDSFVRQDRIICWINSHTDSHCMKRDQIISMMRDCGVPHLK